MPRYLLKIRPRPLTTKSFPNHHQWIRQCVSTEDGIQVVAMRTNDKRRSKLLTAWAGARISCTHYKTTRQGKHVSVGSWIAAGILHSLTEDRYKPRMKLVSTVVYKLHQSASPCLINWITAKLTPGCETLCSHCGENDDLLLWSAPCSLVETDLWFGGVYFLHHQGDGGIGIKF
jgi:hypothetical protein